MQDNPCAEGPPRKDGFRQLISPGTTSMRNVYAQHRWNNHQTAGPEAVKKSISVYSEKERRIKRRIQRQIVHALTKGAKSLGLCRYSRVSEGP
jgi:hypothetical protein